MSCGYYLSAATMTADEHGPAVPELTRRITLASCSRDPAAALAGVLARMPGQGVTPGDILADSGYPPPRPGHLGQPAPRRGCPAGRPACTRATAGPAEPMRARSSATQACTARARRRCCWRWSRCHPPPALPRPPPATSRPPS
jgi:hypothetical protein